MMYLTPSLMSQYLSMSLISYLALRKVLVLLCTPDGVPEHLKHVHLLFLDLTKTGKNVHFSSFFNEVIIHVLIMQN
jgi:hypothetical protein